MVVIVTKHALELIGRLKNKFNPTLHVQERLYIYCSSRNRMMKVFRYCTNMP